MNKEQNRDIYEFCRSFELTEELANTYFLVTGSTGLIGSILVKCLLALNRNIRILCPVRNEQKANEIFGNLAEKISFKQIDTDCHINNIPDEITHIVHCACPTSGMYMESHPVETFEFSVSSTRYLLKYAKEHNVKGMVFVSSLEYYGQITNPGVVTEDMMGFIDHTNARSSYPLGKQASEFLCYSYAKEYGVNVSIARLTQTLGAGISKTDNRVFAQFARSIINNEDIVLHTKGESAKPYCYTTDSVSAILYILLRGQRGESYNVANDQTFISIKDLACFLRDTFNKSVSVKINLTNSMGYAPTTCLNLSTEKIRSLGWKPNISLFEMFSRLIKSLK